LFHGRSWKEPITKNRQKIEKRAPTFQAPLAHSSHLSHRSHSSPWELWDSHSTGYSHRRYPVECSRCPPHRILAPGSGFATVPICRIAPMTPILRHGSYGSHATYDRLPGSAPPRQSGVVHRRGGFPHANRESSIAVGYSPTPIGSRLSLWGIPPRQCGVVYRRRGFPHAIRESSIAVGDSPMPFGSRLSPWGIPPRQSGIVDIVHLTLIENWENFNFNVWIAPSSDPFNSN